MRYIKKVAVTPTVDEGGKIIDSFGTNDNHAKNAPSLKAVEERTDNNLLFNGWFANGQNGVKGWSVNPSQGSAGQFGFSYKGLSLTTGFVGSLVSPSFCPVSPLSDYENNGYSVTVKYRLSNSEEILTAVSEGIFDLSDNDITIVGNGNLLVKLVGPVQQSGRFVLQVTAYTNVFIIGVKLEKGAKASNFNPYGKDAGINELIGDLSDTVEELSEKTTDAIIVRAFATPGFQVAPNSWQPVKGTYDVSGYEPVAVVGVRLLPDNVTALIREFYVSRDSSDNKKKANISVYNPTQSTITVQLNVQVMYKKV